MFTLTKRTLTVMSVVAAASAPSTAIARVVDDNPAQPQQSQLESLQQAVTRSFGPTSGSLAGPVQAPSDHSLRATGTSPQEGFQWDDAGLGAAGMLVLLGTGAGSAILIGRRRAHQIRTS